jgi:deazaflavin-dependent oxidoreductase (nitroreductase family)
VGGICHAFPEIAFVKAPRIFWRLTTMGPRVVYALGLGPLVGRSVLLLTTYGRKTGRPRVTPLMYEQQGDTLTVASARGSSADWLRNIMAKPRVAVRVGRRQFDGIAEATTDPAKIADYLQRQLERNPAAFSAILRSEGLSSRPSRADLIQFAPRRPMVTIRPIDDAG